MGNKADPNYVNYLRKTACRLYADLPEDSAEARYVIMLMQELVDKDRDRAASDSARVVPLR